jgi:hypothetical protein
LDFFFQLSLSTCIVLKKQLTNKQFSFYGLHPYPFS